MVQLFRNRYTSLRHKNRFWEYHNGKDRKEVIMNCLLLLVILCFCGQGNSVSSSENDRCCHVVPRRGNGNHPCMATGDGRNLAQLERENSCECNMRSERNGEDCSRKENHRENECGCTRQKERENSFAAVMDSGCGSSSECRIGNDVSSSRTHYPYLELEPRTCGCEERPQS